MTSSEKSAAYRWGILGLYTLGFSVTMVAISSLGLLLPKISKELSLSPSEQGWLGSSVLFGNLLFAVPLNLWTSRFRPWIAGTVIYSLGTVLIAFSGWAPTFALLLIARVGLGLVQQSSQAPRTLLVIQWISPRRIGLANGFSISIVDILMGTGLIFIPLVMEWVGGWRNTLYTWAGVSLVSTMLWIAFGKDRATPDFSRRMRTQRGTPLASIFRYREISFICVGVFGVLLSRMAFSNFWPTFLESEHGIAATTIGFMFGALSLSMAPSEFLLVAIPIVVRHRTTALVGCGTVQCLSYLGMISTGSVPLLFILSVLNGIGFGFFPILLTMIFGLPGIKPREVAVASSVMSAVMWGGGALGPILVGFVQESTGDLGLGLLISSFGPVTLIIGGLLLGGHRMSPASRALRRGALEPVLALLGIEENSLLSRLRADESLMEIARERGIGPRRMRAALAGSLPRAAVDDLLGPEARGKKAFLQLTGAPTAGEDETVPGLDCQPRRA